MLRALRILFSNRKTSTHRGKATGRRYPEMLRVFADLAADATGADLADHQVADAAGLFVAGIPA